MEASAVVTAQAPANSLEVIDEEAMRAASTFPIPPEELIKKCQEVLLKGVGCDEPELLAPDFEFAGPVVGPINKEQYLKTVSGAIPAIIDAFPDTNAQYYDFRVDVFEPNRVWYTSRGIGTMTQPFTLVGEVAPNYKKIEQPPQTGSMLFNEQGLCTEVTAGYVMDRREGNTGGLGAVYAVLRHVGISLPYPEGQPWQPSPAFRLFLEATFLADWLSGGLFGKPPAAENAYWRRPEEELNSKRAPNKWRVGAVYKPGERRE